MVAAMSKPSAAPTSHTFRLFRTTFRHSDKAAAEIASMTPEDVQAGAELAAEAVADAVDKIAGEQN